MQEVGYGVNLMSGNPGFLSNQKNAKTEIAGNTLSFFLVIAGNPVYVNADPDHINHLAMANESKRSQAMEE
jgi:uncharacterized protein (UPF0297 family)